MPPARIVLWVGSIGGLALLARSLFIEPVPLWIAVLALVAYFGFSLVGLFVPSLEMYGDTLTKGDGESRAIALTFDGGPSPKTTHRVLAMLARHEARATFFLVGRQARLHPEIVREIAEAGHEVAVGGYIRDRFVALKPPRFVAEDIERSQRAVEDAVGFRPTLFRTSTGQVSARTASGAKKAGVSLVAWSAAAPLEGDPDEVASKMEKALRPGAILRFHDADEEVEPVSVDALPRVLRDVVERKLEMVTVSEIGGLGDDVQQLIREAKGKQQVQSEAEVGDSEGTEPVSAEGDGDAPNETSPVEDEAT